MKSLAKRQKTAFKDFLAADYHNKRVEVRQLYTLVLAHWPACETWTKQALWQRLFPTLSYDDQALRHLLSYTSQHLEIFLAIEALQRDPLRQKISVLGQIPSNTPIHQKLLREAHRIQQKQAHQNAEYYLADAELQAETYREYYQRRPEQHEDFGSLTRSLDTAFLATKLRQIMWLLNHERLYKWGYLPSRVDEFILSLTETDLPEVPAIRLYYYGIQVLQQPDNDTTFQQFKQQLVVSSDMFPLEEARDLYLLAINFGIRQVNDGRRTYFKDVLELYKDGLDQAYLLQNGRLSRFTYHNIVAIALQVDELTWAKDFIDTYTSQLEPAFRERMYNFNRAKIAYAAGQYDEALPLLQRANYHDTLLNLGARTLLLKIYYELGEWDVLMSHLDAFQMYLHRKPDLTYHRTNYRNLIRYTRKLLQLTNKRSEAASELRRQLSSETILTEKDWLLQQLTP
ncbi:MAG: hypothetical protein AAGJ82_08885 [Bacteroidota bacterium]